jgi:ABC-type transporter Mla subunit MlaD
MPLQDLTPQLRTRLNHMERAVGWFVFLATALLLFGFGYYLYHAAERKGWLLEKARFFTFVQTATGLKEGDPVELMGFQVGQITAISAAPPRSGHNVRIDFEINQVNQSVQPAQPYYGYVWSEGSKVKLDSTDFLGKRGLTVTRGTNGFNVYGTRKPQWISLGAAESLADATNWRCAQNIFDENSNLVQRAWSPLTNLARVAELKRDRLLVFHTTDRAGHIAAVWNPAEQGYQHFVGTNLFELQADESPAIADQLQAIVSDVQAALPNFLALTNKLATVLDNAANATSNLNVTIAAAHPLVTNFVAISADLRGPGALGAWAFGNAASFQLQTALTNANSLLVDVDTNLNQVTDQVGASLVNLANITSNLNVQVQANSNFLGGVAQTIQDTDGFIQGLKRHWLLRSAFKPAATNPPAVKKTIPAKRK